MITFKHSDANIYVEELTSGRNKIYVELLNNGLFMPNKTCKTSYPVNLIEAISDVKGPAYLCNEILREESTDHAQEILKYDLLSYLDEEEFVNKRLLDFGCGSGASTMILSRMFPHTEIVGIELQEKLLYVVKERLNHYGYKNVELIISPDPN